MQESVSQILERAVKKSWLDGVILIGAFACGLYAGTHPHTWLGVIVLWGLALVVGYRAGGK
jgi:hypothetical protein